MFNRPLGPAIRLQLWARRAAAFLIAWALVLAPAWTFDQVLGTPLELIIMSWLVVGMGVLITKGIELPFKNPEAIEVTAALRSMWWALLWPRFLYRPHEHILSSTNHRLEREYVASLKSRSAHGLAKLRKIRSRRRS